MSPTAHLCAIRSACTRTLPLHLSSILILTACVRPHTASSAILNPVVDSILRATQRATVLNTYWSNYHAPGLLAASFRRVAPMGDGGAPALYCLAIGDSVIGDSVEDPSPELLRMLAHLGRGVRPWSACRIRGLEAGSPMAVIDSLTGARASVLSVITLKTDSVRNAEVLVSKYVRPGWDASWRCRGTARDGRWRIDSCKREETLRTLGSVHPAPD